MTSGDPLGGGDEPRREPAPVAPESPAYGGGRVPPGAFAPRQSGEMTSVPAERLASWGQRALAAIIDALLIGVVAAVVFAILAVLLTGAAAVDSEGGLVGVIVVALIALPAVAIAALVYAPLVMSRTNGKTLGKMATGCRVVRTNGRPVDFLWAAYREVLIKSLLVGIVGSITAGIGYLVNFLWPLFDDRNRAVHDIVVDSLVVKD